ncbi:haloalkane dehalogenase [Pseudomonadales bacterium]|nr:haloalkane dehalogenase [Pseudomonadales bacterium]
MKILRTPDSCFDNLPGYNFEPHYTTITDSDGSEIRIHSIDEGPRDAEPILLMHGNPSWAYLYRHMIPALLATGRRVIAVDLVGCGRSDKPAKRKYYTLARHYEWMSKWLLANELSNITLFCQDWGGTIGLYLVSEFPERFDRVIASNTGIPAGEGGNKWLRWWLRIMKILPAFPFDLGFKNSVLRPQFSDAEYFAYKKAPFPQRKYQAGIRQFPQLIAILPGNPGVPLNKIIWEKLKTFDKPFLTLFGDKDPISYRGEKIFKKFVPGAKGQKHKIIAGAGHFIQEDKPEELVEAIIPFLEVSI